MSKLESRTLLKVRLGRGCLAAGVLLRGTPCGKSRWQTANSFGIDTPLGQGATPQAAVSACTRSQCKPFNHTACGRVLEVVDTKGSGFPPQLLGQCVRNTSRTVNGRAVYEKVSGTHACGGPTPTETVRGESPPRAGMKCTPKHFRHFAAT